MPNVFITHECRRYSDIDQLPPPSPAYAHALGYDPFLPESSPLCASLDALAEVVATRLGAFGAFIALHDGITQRVVAAHWHSKCESDAPYWLAANDSDKDAWLWLAGLDSAAAGTAATVRLDEDHHTSGLRCVTDHPHLTYYAAVPILSTRGLAIGSVFILDVFHRPSSTQRDANLLHTTAQKAMAQLEFARAAYLRHRLTAIHSRLKAFVRSRKVIAQVNEEPPPLRRQPSDTDSTSAEDCTHPNPELDPKVQEYVRSTIQPEWTEKGISRPQSSPAHGEEQESGDAEETTYRQIFARAAEALRAGMDVDGVAFLDGLVGFHGCSVPVAEPETELEKETAGPPGRQASSGSATQGDLDHGRRTCTSTMYERDILQRRPAECLGIAVRDDDSWPISVDISPTTMGIRHLNEGLLQKAIEKYPDGKMFYFDDETGKAYMFSGDDELVPADDDEHVHELAASFPGARYILFSPLTDPVTLKRLAGGIAWTNRTSPCFTQKTDLPLFKTFLSSLESEISRVDAIAAVKQQEAFVSSVSHELRTPLHGILGAVEFLSETKLDDFQQGLAETISNCGSTLHETLSSVLAYAKINQFERRRNKPVQRSIRESPWSHEDKIEGHEVNDAEGLHCAANIATLCEEVLDVTSSGYAHNRSAENIAQNLTIVLDIDSRIHGKSFLTEPAILRRILTNIIGNALKYTPSGFVHVELGTRAPENDTSGMGTARQNTTLLEFTVTDSGKGMSERFLKEQLFLPFRQENAISSEGVGLGMSIVKSMVTLLRGTVSVQSKPGEGSRFCVTIPMGEVQDLAESSNPSNALSDAVDKIRECRHTVALHGFDDRLQKSLSGYFQNTFGWEVLQGKQADDADVVVIDNATNIAKLRKDIPVLLGIFKKPIRANRDILAADHAKVDISTTRPIGPLKLSKAILACLSRLDAREKGRCDQDPVVVTSQDEKSARRVAAVRSGSMDSQPTLPRSKSPATDPRPQLQLPTTSGYPTTVSLPDRSTAGREREPRLLLVEDNQVNAKLLRTFLTKRGYKDLRMAENGQLAVEEVMRLGDESTGFDLIFMDISMPVMDGFEATLAIRSFERQQRDGARPALTDIRPRAYIAALTGLASTRDKDRAYKAGVDVVLTKPIKFAELSKLLERWKNGELTPPASPEAPDVVA